MSAKDKIKKNLEDVYEIGEINAGAIYKGWEYDGMQISYGWHFAPFNRTPIYIGKSVEDCAVTISAWKDEQEEAQ